eukprot:TRINITY_DN3147_c0_g1_i4.p2 TRINITY_DN3147_c0_g1~~TRINITY_DN3147_c0_g1_i4.p2  ORF type:complete len:192 (+),score=66.43 TRINITY_DN3147_c0_g1_i4:103-678(+)
MFLVNWFFGVLSALGLYNKRARILFLGLDNAGKTTLLHMLKDDKLVIHEPTRYPQSEELQIGNIRFKTHDLGGHQAARRLWKDYFTSIDGIVFLVDASDPARFPEARTELAQLLADEGVGNVPFLVLGNKIDVRGAVDEAFLRESLGLGLLTTGKEGRVAEGIRPLELYMCSVVKRAGYADGFKWLSNYLK